MECLRKMINEFEKSLVKINFKQYYMYYKIGKNLLA